MLNNYRGNANQNHKISTHFKIMAFLLSKRQDISADENIEKNLYTLLVGI